MPEKKYFDEEAKRKIEELKEAAKNTDVQEEKEALESGIDLLEETSKISEESEKWIEKQEERNKLISEWKEETKYEYKKNMDTINDTIDTALRNSVSDWYEDFKGKQIINKEALENVIDNLEYEFMMEDSVELETKVAYSTQALSGNMEYCVWVDYKFRMDENMAMHKRWKFDVTDIIRDSKMNWLFD